MRWGHGLDTKYEAWLERHVAPLVDALFDWGIPLIEVIGLSALVYVLASALFDR